MTVAAAALHTNSSDTAESSMLVPSPVGELLVTASGVGVTAILFDAHRGESADRLRARAVEAAGARSAESDAMLARARRQLEEYFAGERRAFDLPLAAAGTDFQQKVWAALLEVPYGATASYGDIARRIGAPSAVRAVGAANGRNPISIVVPCHRVIGSSGSLTGYGGGIERKRFLLALEARGAGDRLAI